MIELPTNWRWSTVAAEGTIDLGRQRHPNWHTGPEMRPYLRVANVFEDRIDTTDLKHMDFSGVFDRYKLRSGDVLLNEGQSPQLLGRPAIYRGVPADIAFTNTLIRFRVGHAITPEWALTVFRHYMHSGRFIREARITTSIGHLSAARLKSVEFPVPPLEEQHRIVAILEGHLSHLDASDANLTTAARRIERWIEGSLDALIWTGDTRTTQVRDILREPMRNGRSDRVASAGENGIRAITLTAVTKNMFIDAYTKQTITSNQTARNLWLEPGDILVQRANTPDLVGTAARFDGPRDWAIFPDLLVRLRANEDVADSRFLVAALRSRRVHSSLRRKAKGLAGSMPKIDQSAIGTTEVPLPPMDRQRSVVARLSDLMSTAEKIRIEVALGRKRSLRLRRSLLAAAFAGQLTGSADLHTIDENVPS